MLWPPRNADHIAWQISAHPGARPGPGRCHEHRRIAITEYCCQQLRDEVEHRCEEHPDPYVCPEHLVTYVAQFDEYGLIVHDGGTSYVEIAFCPWCGTRLPPSQRDRWWSEMERLGIDPWTEPPPPAYRTGAWYRSGTRVEAPDGQAEAGEALEERRG